jgi:hypothetical protein
LVPSAASSKSLAAVGEFKVDAARALLEAEIKDAFLGTAGAAAGVEMGLHAILKEGGGFAFVLGWLSAPIC